MASYGYYLDWTKVAPDLTKSLWWCSSSSRLAAQGLAKIDLYLNTGNESFRSRSRPKISRQMHSLEFPFKFFNCWSIKIVFLLFLLLNFYFKWHSWNPILLGQQKSLRKHAKTLHSNMLIWKDEETFFVSLLYEHRRIILYWFIFVFGRRQRPNYLSCCSSCCRIFCLVNALSTPTTMVPPNFYYIIYFIFYNFFIFINSLFLLFLY